MKSSRDAYKNGSTLEGLKFKNFISHIVLCTELEVGLFLLGLYIFWKNLSLLNMFVGTMSVGDIFLYYYGK
jgi:hypothetical protein